MQFSTDPRFNSGVFDSTTTDNTSFAPLLSTMAPAYVEGGTSYWRVASNDADGNQSLWSAAQTLVMPIQIHLTATGTPFKGKTTTVKVSAKNYGAKGIAGVSVKDANCGVKAKTVKTNASGVASFSVKTTKSGCQIKFTASKTGLIGTTLNVYGY